MEEKTYNFAIIGCGRISDEHFKSINQLEKAKLIAVSDIIEERAKQAGEKHNCDWYSDNSKIYERNDIDIIAVCTPNGTHTKIGKEISNSGKHALIEKPIGIKLEEIDDLIKTFNKNKKKLFVVKQVRYNDAVKKTKEIIEKEGLGKIFSSTLTVRWTRPQEYFNETWRGTKKMDGGTLMTQGIHYVDIMQWLLGPIKSVYAIKDTMAHKMEVEDIVGAIIRFKSGAIGLIEFTVNTYPKNMECSLTILGKKGTVKIGGKALNEIETWEVENIPCPEIKIGKPKIYANNMYQGSCPNHKYVYENLINTLDNKEIEAMSGYEARKAVEIITAIYKSSEVGKPIYFI